MTSPAANSAVTNKPAKKPAANNVPRSQRIAKCALLVALLIVSCFFTIPIGPIPFTLQTAVVILIALLCTPGEAALATGVYLLLGAIGLPVFSGMTGGIIRPSSGFLFSYLIGSVAASALRMQIVRLWGKTLTMRLVADIVCAACIIVISDLLGWFWMAAYANMDLVTAFFTADAPFIAIDCCKAVLSVIVANAVRKALRWS